jgi:transcriptional regulator with XRE-family HTH domain
MENNTNISERILQLIDNKNITLNKLNVLVGASSSYFNKLVKNNLNIGSDFLNKILKHFPDVDPEWLLTGKGEMLREKKYEVLIKEDKVLNGSNEIYGNETLMDRIKLQEETILFLREKIKHLEEKLSSETSEKKLLADIKKIN